MQNCVSGIEKCKFSVDNGGAFGTLITDLSKAFDCLQLRELLIAKLDIYFLQLKSRLIQQYFSYRKHG